MRPLIGRISLDLRTNEDISRQIQKSPVLSASAKDHAFQGLTKIAANVGADQEDINLALANLKIALGIDEANRDRTEIPFQASVIGLDDIQAGQLIRNYAQHKRDLVPKDAKRAADPLQAFALELAKAAGLPDSSNSAISFGVIDLDENQKVQGESIRESIAAQIWSGNIKDFPERFFLKPQNLTMTNTTAQKMRDDGGAAIVILVHPVLQTSYVGIIRTPKTEKLAIAKDPQSIWKTRTLLAQ